jgi:streptomycin 6-kinase
VSVVLNCRAPGDTPAILKLSPDYRRVEAEARALAAWRTPQVPTVMASDVEQGALLLEAILPGTALDESGVAPTVPALATLVHALHGSVPPPSWVRPVEERIASLYRSGEAIYLRRPELEQLVPRSLYDSGRRAADALAAQADRSTMLHGDLTPANVLDGGPERGLVAIDPAPCWGDPAFDTIDLLLWQPDDLGTLTLQAHRVAELLGLAQERPLDWCAAFAAMVALEHAEAHWGDPPSARLRMLIELAHLT